VNGAAERITKNKKSLVAGRPVLKHGPKRKKARERACNAERQSPEA
jgi:hypothetical protein